MRMAGAGRIIAMDVLGEKLRVARRLGATDVIDVSGSNYGSVRPAVDIPVLVDRYMDGQLRLDELVSSRRPLEAAAASLDDLEAGRARRTLLIP
jgi:S-(hydroxymethyl)glutathione dehydrogenase/alcohol dehydrogenase